MADPVVEHLPLARVGDVPHEARDQLQRLQLDRLGPLSLKWPDGDLVGLRVVPEPLQANRRPSLSEYAARTLSGGAFTAEIGPSARSWHFWRIVGIVLAITALVGLLAWFRRRRYDRDAERAPSGSPPSV